MANDEFEDDITADSWFIPGKPAILIEEKNFGKILIIADLHIGFVYGQNKKGIIVPTKMLPEEELLDLVLQYKPRRVIVLGDFKDEIYGTANPLPGRIWEFFKRIKKYTRLTIIKGNHDGKLEEVMQEGIEIVPTTGLKLEERKTGKSIGLWHGHANPALDVIDADITIMGHAHPAYKFRDELGVKITEKVWVKAKWLSTSNRNERVHIILPAFNQFIEGYSVDENIFKATVLMREGIDFDNAEVFTLDGILIGTIKDLQEQRAKLEEKKKKRRK
ncbi:MAG: hypothetical protein FK734_13780 [Asgard group archaeon]|nr:hypothetical protein [Asgard group archaeon]